MKYKKRVDIVSVKLHKETSLSFAPRKIDSPRDASELIRKFVGQSDREEMVVVTVDTKNQPTTMNLCSRGTLNYSVVHAREVFKTAILSNSASIIIGHTHPSGIVTPSKEDCEITKRLSKVGKLLGIELLDHIILGESEFYSFKANQSL